MNNRLKDVIGTLEHSELVKIKQDIEQGGIHVKKLVEAQIQENEKRHECFCAVCSSDIDPRSTNTFTLIFGPDGFKKKASFCAEDCLRYFLNNLEALKKGSVVKKTDPL